MDMLAAHVVSPQLKPQNHRAPTPTPLCLKVAKLGQVFPQYHTGLEQHFHVFTLNI